MNNRVDDKRNGHTLHGDYFDKSNKCNDIFKVVQTKYYNWNS